MAKKPPVDRRIGLSPTEKLMSWMPRWDPERCWEWRGPVNLGYGYYVCGGKKFLAHRVAWEFFVGPIPKGVNVLHSCDNPPCCNISHLFLGTHQDNVADKVKKFRQAIGEAHGRCKLSTRQVLEIRARRDRGEIARDIASDYGVSISTVSHIGSRAGWRWLPEGEEKPWYK